MCHAMSFGGLSVSFFVLIVFVFALQEGVLFRASARFVIFGFAAQEKLVIFSPAYLHTVWLALSPQ